jgi:hypothetical protein
MQRQERAMSQTHERLAKGRYAYSSHSLRIAGDIAEVFIAKWENHQGGERLHKYPPHADIKGGALVCVLRLRKPIPMEEYKELHHPSMRPIVKRPELEIDELKVHAVLMDSSMVCTFPDSI